MDGEVSGTRRVLQVLHRNLYSETCLFEFQATCPRLEFYMTLVTDKQFG